MGALRAIWSGGFYPWASSSSSAPSVAVRLPEYPAEFAILTATPQLGGPVNYRPPSRSLRSQWAPRQEIRAQSRMSSQPSGRAREDSIANSDRGTGPASYLIDGWPVFLFGPTNSAARHMYPKAPAARPGLLGRLSEGPSWMAFAGLESARPGQSGLSRSRYLHFGDAAPLQPCT